MDVGRLVIAATQSRAGRKASSPPSFSPQARPMGGPRTKERAPPSARQSVPALEIVARWRKRRGRAMDNTTIVNCCYNIKILLQ